jgi:LysM domain/Lamin Tail Domain
MTRKQALFIIVVNAVVSTVISVVVALLVFTRGGIPARTGPSVEQANTPPAQTASIAAVATEMGAAPAVESTAFAAAPILYVVQPGDTLLSLSVRFDVPAADIIAANQIPNPDFLPAGVEIVIPLGGLSQAVGQGGASAATWTPIPTATDTPLPFEPPSADLTVTTIVEPGGFDVTPTPAMSATGDLQVEITEIVGMGDIQRERVVISNVGDQVADMDGWSLSDDEGNTYWFPAFRLWGKASVAVDSRVGQDGDPPLTLYWGRLLPAWSIGEVATLKNAAGKVVTIYPIR